MPKYFEFKVCGYYLYFTSHCIIEPIHVHTNKDGKLKEYSAGKIWVKENGETSIVNIGNMREK